MRIIFAALSVIATQASLIDSRSRYDPYGPYDPHYGPRKYPRYEHNPGYGSRSHTGAFSGNTGDAPRFKPYLHKHSGLRKGHHNPWTGEGTKAQKAEFEGWYSPSQKYSPPYKAYKPDTTGKTEYATC